MASARSSKTQSAYAVPEFGSLICTVTELLAEESFDCVMCGVCSSRCPAGISHPQVAMLARRLNGKYLAPKSAHLEKRVQEIQEGAFEGMMEELMQKPLAELQELYNHREIEQ